MQRVLFHSIIFGPIHSRRLGTSLGINLMPDDGKVCTFDCLYCEAGYNAQGPGTTGLPSRAAVAAMLDEKLRQMLQAGEPLDVITFSGNGEPTVHPDFEGIVDDTIALRDRYFPAVKISVLCNATMLAASDSVVRAMLKVDNPIVKLDSAVSSTIRRLDRPVRESYGAAEAINGIKRLRGSCIVQTMLLRGADPDGNPIDNTTPVEVEALGNALLDIEPRGVMLYSIDRPTPCTTLTKVSHREIEQVARHLEAMGVKNIMTT